jgi:phosphoribosylpyrophosphate synthetase
MTTGDRLIELLQVLDVLRNPRSVYYEEDGVRVVSEGSPDVIEVICLHTAFSKQDEVYRTGESNSARLAAELLLAAGADRLVFVDPHTPLDYDWLQGLITDGRVHVVSMYEAVLKTLLPKLPPDLTIICTPGKQRTTLGWTLPRISKVRVRTDEVLISGEVAPELVGHPVLLIDDMVISGTTIVATRRHLASRGVREVNCWITHSLPGRDGDEGKLRAVMDEFEGRFYSSNTVRTRLFEEQYPENKISCASIIIDYLKLRWKELESSRETT